jgi:Dolichyl-phosphate-mannose-protein mannosyltransferase
MASGVSSPNLSQPSLAVPAEAAKWCAQSPPLSWAFAFGVLLAMAAVVLWAPLAGIPAHFAVNYNEGWNTYLQRTAAAGGRVYGNPPVYVFAAYPPISFHLVGALGKLMGSMVVAGRCVSAASFFAVAVLLGLTVRRLTGVGRCGIYAGLTFLIFIAMFAPERIAMDDPHLPGMAFGALGLYCFVRAPFRTRWLCLSAAAFAVSLFTKQSLVAIPAAIAVYLFFHSRKALIAWLAAALAISAMLLALTFAIDGPHFLEHFAFSRAYSVPHIWENFGGYILYFQTSIALAVVWLFFAPRKGLAPFLVWSFLLSHLIATWFAGGDGVARNILFDPVVSLVLIAGVLAPYAAHFSARSPWPEPLLAALLLFPFLGLSAPLLGGRIGLDMSQWRGRRAKEAEFARVVDFVKSRPGDALCEIPLVCYEAGKPERYDAYTLGELVKTGKMPEAELLRLLRERRLAVVQMELLNPGGPPSLNGLQRFPDAFARELPADYQLALRTPHYALYIPR